MKQKKIPMRKCIGCSMVKPKKELLRIVKVSEKLLQEGKETEPICLDTTGKLAGRGAYICYNPACLKVARKSKRLEREFETTIADALYDSLLQEMEDMDGTAP